jgi:gamma-glutamylcyclotransferase (GGCT)/AIG2-like uncharacterized protein YtfP
VHTVFVYGTLQHPPLLHRLLGRVPASVPAELTGHRAAPLAGRAYPGLVRDEGGVAPGRLLVDLTDDDLVVLDAFEGPEYERIGVVATVDGADVPADAWLLTGPSRRLAEAGQWSLERFLAEDVESFLGRSVPGGHHPTD